MLEPHQYATMKEGSKVKREEAYGPKTISSAKNGQAALALICWHRQLSVSGCVVRE